MEAATATRPDHISTEPGGPAVATIREGDAVMAEDGVLGRVERLVQSDPHTPAFLVVRAGRVLRRRYPVVPVSFVTVVDPGRRLVWLRGRCGTIGRMSETLPLVL
jgi:hypothetical protein